MAIAVIISFPLATLAAVKKGFRDRPGRSIISLLGLSLPNFLARASAHDYLFHPAGLDAGLRSRWARSFSSPSLTLGMGMAAILTRILRGSLLQVNQRRLRAQRSGQRTERKHRSGSNTRCAMPAFGYHES